MQGQGRRGAGRGLMATIAVGTALLSPSAASAAAGDLDTSFDGDGRVTTGFGTTPFHASDTANATARGPSGEIYVAGNTPAQGGNFAVVRYTAAGALDTTFGDNGIASIDIATNSNEDAQAIAVDAIGNVVLAGRTSDGEDRDFALVRLTATGDPDTSFGGGDGIVVTDFTPDQEDFANDLAILPSGNVVVAGSTDTDPDDNVDAVDFALASYGVTGVLDPAFDGDGKVTTDFGSEEDEATGVVAQGSNLVAAGVTDPTGDDDRDFAVARYVGGTGALDSTFGSVPNGREVFNMGSDNDFAQAIALDSANKILVGGNVESPSGNSDFAAARLGVNGVLDSGFDTDGRVTASFPGSPSSSDQGRDIAAGPSDSVIVVGATGFEATSAGNGAQWVTVKWTSAGVLDTAFDGAGPGDGFVATNFTIPPPADSEAASGVLVDATTIVVTGTGNANFAAARLSATDGNLDSTFGTGGTGKVETDVVSPIQSSESARDVALQPDGKAIVVGSTNNGATSQFEGDQEFGVARYHPDGSLDQAFGLGGHDGDGRVSTNFADNLDMTGTEDLPRAVAVQSDGKIVVVGKTDPPSTDGGDFAIARYEADGDLDTTFGAGNGLVTTNFGGTEADEANAVALKGTAGTPSFRIVVAGAERDGGATGDFAVAVYTEDGTLDNGFDGDGKQTTDFGQGDVIHDVAVQSDGNILAAGEAFGFSPIGDFALARYLPTGAPDDSFDTDGRVTTDFAGDVDIARGIAITESAGAVTRIVVAGQATSAGGGDGALAAYLPGGTLDPAFAPGGADGDGRLTVDLNAGGNIDALRDVVVQPDGKIVASGSVEAPDYGLVRTTAAGALDPSFGGDGLVSTPIGTFANQRSLFGLALLPDGRLLAAGGAQIAQQGSDFELARFLTDPPPVVTPPVQSPAQPKKKKCKKKKKKKRSAGAAAKKKCKKKKRR